MEEPVNLLAGRDWGKVLKLQATVQPGRLSKAALQQRRRSACAPEQRRGTRKRNPLMPWQQENEKTKKKAVITADGS